MSGFPNRWQTVNYVSAGGGINSIAMPRTPGIVYVIDFFMLQLLNFTGIAKGGHGADVDCTLADGTTLYIGSVYLSGATAVEFIDGSWNKVVPNVTAVKTNAGIDVDTALHIAGYLL